MKNFTIEAQYKVTVDYEKSLEEMIDLGQYA